MRVLKARSHVGVGEETNTGDLWTHGAAGIPSVSFNTAKKKVCGACGETNFYQTPQDISVNSLELVNTSEPRMTVAQLVNAHFEEKGIQRPRHRFSTCKTCNEDLPLQQKTVFVDRPPHILCVALNIKEPDTLPDLNDWREVLDGFDLAFETIQGSTRHVFYECVALVYITGPENNHWVAANRVQCSEQKNRPTGYRWLLCDGMKTTCSVISGRTFNPLIRKGKVARLLYKRVYVDIEHDGKMV
ncbi:hypothetical protein D6C77_06766 [Aureobasidium pullulans]|uniref:PAN2 UCH domain-containing protein n=1 Tax=Aureobasidium pullulans TaxID=5580 RepID=A0AB74J5B6_AURPU|nr:hypothetical protein D6D21_02428 [Aureobasidium pullulans]THX28260.1 hypothetical protein D6D12_04950 [Aureobasidium pullulans]THX52408.1 hypothetical protein D6D11_04752 [Aureobasidium pullulans]THX94567.1 hypothetical protein D6D08_01588 [Aureobasidium pullulans]TIA56667.1 hypothetical protein D6C77_06766 [Aureobasidium pullulans]